MADIKTLVTKGDLSHPTERLSAVGAELCVLVTGFSPFGGDLYDASGVTAKALDGRRVDALGRGGYYAARIVGRGDIPSPVGVDRNLAVDAVLSAILDARPDVVICLGPGEDVRFRVELRARDNDAHHDPRLRSASPTYRSTYGTGVDPDRLIAAIRSANGDATSGEDGSFHITEDLFYHVVRYVETRPGDLDLRVAGFIHVPRYVLVDTGRRVAHGSGGAHATPNEPLKPADKPVKQSTIDDAVYRAIEATVAAVPPLLDAPPRYGGARLQYG